MKLSVVIPVFNEASTLETMIGRVEAAPLPDEISELEIVLVDDHSTDGTGEILARLENRHTVLSHPSNHGKGGALRSGFAVATGDVVLVQDADLEYDPNDYARVLRPIIDGQADVVYGSRFLGATPARVADRGHRLGNQALTALSNVFSGLELSDIETCYKAFSRRVLDKLAIRENRFGVEPEITAKIGDLARHEGIRVRETPISYRARSYREGKKIGLGDAVRAFYCILKYNTSPRARFVRYALVGLLVAASQLLALAGLVELGGLRGVAGENVANLLSIEISLLLAFLLHGRLTWPDARRESGSGLAAALRRLLSFHAVTLSGVALRALLFYALSLTGIAYTLNALLGIALVVGLNFLGYDRLVFRRPARS